MHYLRYMNFKFLKNLFLFFFIFFIVSFKEPMQHDLECPAGYTLLQLRKEKERLVEHFFYSVILTG